MLRLSPFRLEQPTTLEEVQALLRRHGAQARLVAGGTDLLPHMKLARVQPQVLVSLRRVEALAGIARLGTALRVGAGVRLDEVAHSPLVRAHAPVLAEAAGRVAGPQIRQMGTLGGNLCLDTRCRYVNQGALFREALGGCLKSHGDECHVVPGGQGCVAALSSDTAPALIALGAHLEILGPGGPRTCGLDGFYRTDGLAHTALEAGEIVTGVVIPAAGARQRFAWCKWAVRRSIDFPLVSFALRLDLAPPHAPDGGAPGAVSAGPSLTGGLLVVSVLGPRPRLIELARFAGQPVASTLAEQVSAVAFSKCRPLPNVPYDPEYRRERLAVEVRRAVLSLADQEGAPRRPISDNPARGETR